VFEPKTLSCEQLLKVFFEAHDPQGMRQGNDVGTQYRSGIYVANEAQRRAVEAACASYQQALIGKGVRPCHHGDRGRPTLLLCPRITISSISRRTRAATAG